jgi:hypothetical protein
MWATSLDQRPNTKKTLCKGPYAVVNYKKNVHSRVDYNTFIMDNPMPESSLTLSQSRLYPPVRAVGFSLSVVLCANNIVYALV